MSKVKAANVEQEPALLDYEAFARLADQHRQMEADRIEAERAKQLERDRAEFRTLLWKFARTGLSESDGSRFQSLANRLIDSSQDMAELVEAARELDRLADQIQLRDQRAEAFERACVERKRLEVAADEARREQIRCQAMLNVSSRAIAERGRLARSFTGWIFEEDVTDAN